MGHSGIYQHAQLSSCPASREVCGLLSRGHLQTEANCLVELASHCRPLLYLHLMGECSATPLPHEACLTGPLATPSRQLSSLLVYLQDLTGQNKWATALWPPQRGASASPPVELEGEPDIRGNPPASRACHGFGPPPACGMKRKLRHALNQIMGHSECSAKRKTLSSEVLRKGTGESRH